VCHSDRSDVEYGLPSSEAVGGSAGSTGFPAPRESSKAWTPPHLQFFHQLRSRPELVYVVTGTHCTLLHAHADAPRHFRHEKQNLTSVSCHAS
jgi:hypothetical protein